MLTSQASSSSRRKKLLLSFSSVALASFFVLSPLSSKSTDAASVISTQAKIWKFTSCDFDNLDRCAQIVLLFGARSLIIPNNTIDMVPHCEEEKSAVKCVSDWGKSCLKSFSRHLLKIALAGGAKNIRERCSAKGTEWYLRNFKCVNDSLPHGHNCMDVIKQEVNLIRFNPNQKEWISTGCCYLDKFKGCFQKAIEPYCNDDGKEFMNWCANSYFADIVDMACSKDLSWGSEKCNSMIANIKVPSNFTEPPPHSVFVPLYKLLLEFGDIGVSELLSKEDKP